MNLERREALERLLEACQTRMEEYHGRSVQADIPSVENALYCLCRELTELEAILLWKRP